MGKRSKDKRDYYFRKAKEEGWRARSAYKLLQIDNKFNIFEGVKRALDLCAAPGSWSQVLCKKLYGENEDEQASSSQTPDSDVKIVAVDLQTMAPLPGVLIIKGDLTHPVTAEQVIKHFDDNPADLVVCDASPDITRLRDWDIYLQAQMILSALRITTNVLKRGGTFLAKIFRCSNAYLVIAQLQTVFKDVVIAKPPSSRNSSIEGYVVCRNYDPPADFDPKLRSNFPYYDKKFMHMERKPVPFVYCGDKNSLDSDTLYPLQMEGEQPYVYREPVQPPIDPPYKQALMMRDKIRAINQRVNNLEVTEVIGENEYEPVEKKLTKL